MKRTERNHNKSLTEVITNQGIEYDSDQPVSNDRVRSGLDRVESRYKGFSFEVKGLGSFCLKRVGDTVNFDLLQLTPEGYKPVLSGLYADWHQFNLKLEEALFARDLFPEDFEDDPTVINHELSCLANGSSSDSEGC